MFRVMIVEDEKPILDLMKRLVGQHPLLEVAGAFASAAEALAAFPQLRPDAAFLDVEMPKMGGIELADKLKAMDDALHVVFTTAYPEYALEAFRVSAVDYLLKPVTPDGIERAVSRLAKNQSKQTPSVEPASEEPRVRCLGTFETRGADSRLMSWPTRKTEELFAYFLVYPNRLLGKWQLADMLWPDLEEDRAIHNVHNTIYRLKKSLKEAGIEIELTNTNEGYHFQVPASFTDLGRFRDFMGRTTVIDDRNVQEGERHFRMYKGELFGGKDYVWSTGAAAEAASQYVGLTRMLIAYHRESSHEAAAKETIHAYLAHMPLDEEMNGELLRLYFEKDEIEPFRRHYERYRHQLQEELGVEPSDEIKRMAEKIK